MGERRIRIGVIGAGTFAEEAHIPGIQAHRQGEVAALCARNQPRAAAMAARLGVPDVYTDYHELLARPDIEAVTIATPDVLHAPIALAALAAGKHVFCEKPLAMTVAQAEQMVAVAARADRIAMVGFTFRYTRALQTLRRLLGEGALGTPFHVSLHVHWGAIGYPGPALGWADHADQAAAGAWGDAAPHLFDALAYILAPVREVCAQMMIVSRDERRPQPDSVDIAMCLARLHLPGYDDPPSDVSAFADRERGHVQATLFASRVDQPYRVGDEIQVVGTRGAASCALSRGAHERLSLCRVGTPWEDLPLGDDATTEAPLALSRMMGAFIDAVIRGHLDREQDPSFADGLRAQRAIEAAVRSARAGRWEAL
ncbi:MAG TPA: Gfo/Idh/MocA family oxidoreductase [Chloroflexota bacterium]|nr:Gfo/Idh/MocA family oxidoreductase [Chloroflexota bacterium]